MEIMAFSELQEKLDEFFIRFNTSPKLYEKLDYLLLYEILCELCLTHEIVNLSLKETWDEVIESNTLPNGILTKRTIDEILEAILHINPYTAGNGINITEDVINANTGATTTGSITLSSGAPIDASGIWENNVIPQGTSVLEILEKLLNREIFPSAAQKPDFTISGTSFGIKELEDVVEITGPITTKSNGQFKASFSIPEQPTVEGVTWSNETASDSIISGFDNGDTITLGPNKITYTFSKTYSSPTNMPVTNLGNSTQSTSKISIDDSDLSAVWDEDTIVKTFDITATGVYPIFTNISGSALIDNASTKCSLTPSNNIIIENVPSEVVNGKHFKFAFPADRTVTFEVKDLAGNFVPFSSTYTITEVSNFAHNITYKILETTGDKLGVNTYKFILSKNLSE